MDKRVTEQDQTPASPLAALETLQHWSSIIGQAQQMMIEYAADAALANAGTGKTPTTASNWLAETEKMMQAQASLWSDGLKIWQQMLQPFAGSAGETPPATVKDRRFAAEPWQENPVFQLISQSYLLVSENLLKSVDDLEGLTPRQREQLRFTAKTFVDAMAPSNFPFTNPQVIEKTIETGGENLVTGLKRMLHDLSKGQLTQTNEEAFELGKNIATTPGKVVKETPLYQLIQYAPTTETVDAVPLLIFPPWINRFYILDLNPKNSFIRWAVEQGLTVFVVSWKSADASMAELSMENYVLDGIVDAIDTVREGLDVSSVHVIGYCVAGTTLAAALAWMAAKGQAKKVRSATFFTAQVDFSCAGDLSLLVDDQQLQMIESLSADSGYLDGRYMAATFNLLRGRDLIWNYVVNNYLLGADYPAFDLLYWNGDTTNLPARWHLEYLRDLYRDNKLATPGGLTIGGVPIDLRLIRTPIYVQAGRDDHIAPAQSVWKITEHLRGPIRFVLAGSGHIAGVVNPPAAGKYQFWTNEGMSSSLDAFVKDAVETKGSWWPDWRSWLSTHSRRKVKAVGARIPGEGKLKALEDAPGRYVLSR